MAPVIASLQTVSDADIRAMAAYLASYVDALPLAEADARAARILASTSSTANPTTTAAARLYEGACAVCHERGRDVVFNAGPALGFSTKLQAARPDNFLRVLLFGAESHSSAASAAMPAFGAALDDAPVAELARYVRHRFAPSRPAWDYLDEALARIRKPAD
jgi:nicotinate dehydrogenase subunit B